MGEIQSETPVTPPVYSLGPNPTPEELERASEAERSFYENNMHTVEFFADELGNMVEKAVNIDDEGNGSTLYSAYDKEGNLVGQRTIEIQGNKIVSDTGMLYFDVAPDPESVEEAEEEVAGEWKPVTAGMTIEPDPEAVEKAEEEVAGEWKPVTAGMTIEPDPETVEEAAKKVEEEWVPPTA